MSPVVLLLLCTSIHLLSASPTSVLLSHTQPWKHLPQDCNKYEKCVEIDFSKVPADTIIPSTHTGFAEAFFLEAEAGGEDGTDSCAKPDAGSTRCLYTPKNVNVINGALELLVPGGQEAGPNKTIYTSLVTFTGSQYITTGYFEVVIQTSKVPGTCQAIFTQANPGYPAQKDEQDIEILTGHYTVPSKNIPAGLQLTNWAAFPVNDSDSAREVNKVVPYGFDPTAGFNKFSIEWDHKTTTYTYGSNTLVFTLYSSQNPSKFAINNWSNAGAGWTEGPPLQDNILRVRSFKAYYNSKL